MKLIIILICLSIERYQSFGGLLHRFGWFGNYVAYIQPKLSLKRLKSNSLIIAGILLPILATAFLIYLFMALFGWIMVFLFNLIILFYCIGPDDFYRQLANYFSAVNHSNEAEIAEQQAIFLEIPDINILAEPPIRAMTNGIFWQSQERILSVLFWFIVLGKFGFIGALLHRSVDCLDREVSKPASPVDYLKDDVHFLQYLLDWLSVRLTTLLYLIIGQDKLSFSVWYKKAFGSVRVNEEFLTESGLHALGASNKKASSATIDENHAALALADKVLFVTILLVALFTMGMWIA